MPNALVLNATFEPLCVVSERRALVLVLNHRAAVIEESGTYIQHPAGDISLPTVIRLQRYVRVPYRNSVPLTRRAIFARDGGKCVYCQAPAASIDHVMPRSRGGGHTWENVVSACHRCNHAKADRTLKDLGWKLKRPPHESIRCSMENSWNGPRRSPVGALLGTIWRSCPAGVIS